MPKSLFRDEKSFVALYVLERPCPQEERDTQEPQPHGSSGLSKTP